MTSAQTFEGRTPDPRTWVTDLDMAQEMIDDLEAQCERDAAEIKLLRETMDKIANECELLAYTSAGSDSDLSRFMAIQAGTMRTALAKTEVDNEKV